MRKALIGFGVVLGVVVLAGFFIGLRVVRKSLPHVSGSIDVRGIHESVEVLRDDYGVPHLFAKTEQDGYFAVGYLHAQDRLWQMELSRRAGLGKLAELLGEPALTFDKMFKTLGLGEHAHRLAAGLDAPTRTALQAYADGVNAFIESAKGSYPIEFDMLQTEPEPWTVEHSLLISRLMAWELNYSRWVDLVQMELVRRFGEERAREIFPHWPTNAPLIIPKQTQLKKGISALRTLTRVDGAFRRWMGGPGFGSGSNAWVVGGEKSSTGKPILANDPHLILMAPGRWYELHLSVPGVDVAGTTIPGIPFVVIGRNDRIAWGVTNAMLDDDDFYLEDVDSISHPSKYRLGSEWRPMGVRVDTILVKDALPVLFTVYSTHRGPIVNRMEPGAQFSDALVSMRWVGHELSQEASAFYWLNRAANWSEFASAVRMFAVPAQNFVYADVDGNIGYHMGGRIPIRSSRGYTLPAPGWTTEYDWKGFVPSGSNPQVFNPPSGFIATANNKIVDDNYPHHLSNHYEPPWRAIRLNEVLSQAMRFSVEDMVRLQNDVQSPQAREIVPIILAAYDSMTVTDPDVATALAYFRNWTYDMRAEDVSTTLFQATFDRIIVRTLHDELGPELSTLFDTLASVPFTVVSELLKRGDVEWFDDIRTPNRESRDEIIRRSVGDAIAELKTRLGTSIKEWRWGNVHEVRFEHIFGSNPLLGRLFNVGPFPLGGAHSTVNVSQYFLSNEFSGAVGPSTRQIFDLSDRSNTRSVTPPGQSGQVFSSHYDDQAKLWLNGGTRIMPMDRATIDRTCVDHLTMRPLK